MVLKADQERVKALLSETIMLLCKNGLEYKSEFTIEALIGITVDSDDVFLINIKETVENASKESFCEVLESSTKAGTLTNNHAKSLLGPRKSPKRRRSGSCSSVSSKLSKQDDTEDDNADFSNDQYENTKSLACGPSEFVEDSEGGEPVSKRLHIVKYEPSECDDIVIIKEENISEDYQSPNVSQNFNSSFSFIRDNSQGAPSCSTWNNSQDFPNPGGSSLTAHADVQQSMLAVLSARGPGWFSSRNHRGEIIYNCPLVGCCSSFNEKKSLNRHLKKHLGFFKYRCETCEKGYMDQTNFLRHSCLPLKQNFKMI